MPKPGRKPTGLARKNIVQVALNDEENEYVARQCYEKGISAASYGRQKILPPTWRSQLEMLRRAQHYTPLHKLDGRRKRE